MGVQAQAIKQFVALHCAGVLATKRSDGYPGGALVPYDVDSNGAIYMFIAGLTQHAQDLARDAKASLTICDRFAPLNPQPFPRVVIYGEVFAVAGTELGECLASYQERFPLSRYYPHDFVLYRLNPTRIYWNGGFGTAGWVPMSEYPGVALDLVSYRGMAALDHINSHHRDVVVRLASTFALEDAARSALMVSVTSKGCTVQFAKEGRIVRRTIPFLSEIQEVDQLEGAFKQLMQSLESGPMSEL
jgi:putative heme iron utilization protein